jgi:Leucine-rich repeat (LRR) protein
MRIQTLSLFFNCIVVFSLNLLGMERPPKATRNVAEEATLSSPPSPLPQERESHPISASPSEASMSATSGKRKQVAPTRAFKKSRGQEESFSIRYYLIHNPQIILSRIKGTTIDLSYLNISSLEGLLQIPKITQMNHLILAHNLIREIKREDFTGLKELITLDLSNNLLEFIFTDSFFDLENLTNLFLNDNIIRTLQHDALGGLNQLNQLSLSHNKIKEIDAKMLNGAFNLEILNLSNNEIKTIEPHTFVRLTFLKRLDLNGNQLSQLNKNIFDVPKAEGYINIRAKKVPPFELQYLKILNLRDNKLTEIPTPILSRMPALEQLLLTNNLIALASDTNINALKKASNLKTIDLVNNQLTDAALKKLHKALPEVKIIATVAMEPTQEIEQLAQLSRGKRLKEVQKEESVIESLERVSVAKSFSDIEPRFKEQQEKEAAMQTLSSFHKSLRDYIEDEDYSFWLHRLQGTYQKWYDLKNLNLTSLDGLQELPSIETVFRIYLDNNKLTTIPANTFAGLTKLQDIDLTSNKITSFDPQAFAGIPRLRSLNISNNGLKLLRPEMMSPLKSLEGLILETNGIESLPPYIFKDLKKLRHLYLTDNKLREFTAEHLVGLENLEALQLARNQISYIDPEILKPLKKLTLLIISKNLLTKENIEAIKKALPRVTVYF